MLKTLVILMLSLFFIPIIVFAQDKETYKWNDQTIKLPFPKSWLSKKPRENPKDPLVFIDTETSMPRIIGRLYATSYDISLESLSDFKKEFLKSKNRWMKENKAELKKPLSFEFRKKNLTLIYDYDFSMTYGEFREIGRFEKCSKEYSLGLKVLIPISRDEKAKKLELEKGLRAASLCP